MMGTKDIILELRTKKGLSQEELAEKIFVTRQAVSRWENGETIPNTETLKLLSKEFDVSINTLLGSPQNLNTFTRIAGVKFCFAIIKERSNNKLLVNSSGLWYNMITTNKGGDYMETKDIILELRMKKRLSQEALAEKVFVTRQAVSRWENGETISNIDTLKLLSKLFDVSINTLLGSPRELVCQCCGMLLVVQSSST